MPIRCQLHLANTQQASVRTTQAIEEKVPTPSASPFLARAALYSVANSSPKLSRFEADGERRQKSKGFRKKNSLINRLRSGSWHASSSSVKESLEQRKVSEGSGTMISSKKLTNSKRAQATRKDNELSGLIHHVLESHLCNVDYDHHNASDLSSLLSKVLEKSVKSRLTSHGKHFKITAVVYMGEVKDTGIKMATQCVWEPSKDYFAMATYETNTIFVSAMVFATLYNDASVT